MLESLPIIKAAVDSTFGIFSFIKQEKARGKASKYLMNKYSLTRSYGVETRGNWPVGVYYYHRGGWERVLKNIVNKVISSSQLNIETCEYCGDLYLFLFALDYNLIDNKRYILKSASMDSLVDLSRGIGTVLTLEIVQKELIQWKNKEGFMIEKQEYE